MASIGKVSAVFTASTSGLTSGVKAASSSFRSLQSDVASLSSNMRLLTAISGAQLFGSVVGGAMSAAKSVAGLGASAVSSLSAAVEAATSLGEETSKSGVIFGASAAKVAEFAKTASRIGIAESAALSATGTFGNLFTAMGMGKEEAANYATTMTALSADLASFNNSSVEDAIGALGAALRGEAEPIRRFGVLLDDATLKQEALSQGLIKSTTGSLSPAIKAQAAYAAILRQTASAQGDFERTSGSLANMQRMISAKASNVFSTIGTAFEPLYKSIAASVSRVLTAVEPLFAKIAEGIRPAVELIGSAVEGLIPRIEKFLGDLDGKDIGKSIGQGIVDGAKYLATVADQVVNGFRDMYFAAADTLGVPISAEAKRLNEMQAQIQAGLAPQVAVEGSGGFVTQLDQAFAAEVSRLTDAVAEQRKPLTTFTDLVSMAEKALSDRPPATPPAAEPPKPPELKPPVVVNISEAIKGIDSRSSAGVAEMFRLMRGGAGDVQEQQLDALQEIAANTAEDGFTVVEDF